MRLNSEWFAIHDTSIPMVYTNNEERDMCKKLLVFFGSILLLINIWACQQPAQQVDIEDEKEAIKKILQAQLDAVKAFSYEGEAAVWAHRPYIVRKNTAGWDSVSVFYQKGFQEWKSEPDKYLIREYTASNFDIYVNGNFASSSQDEHFEGIWDGEETSGDSRSHKYLEKINGEWKIITLF